MLRGMVRSQGVESSVCPCTRLRAMRKHTLFRSCEKASERVVALATVHDAIADGIVNEMR